MQVTISLLPVSLSLVHIPRSRLHQLSHPVLKQILHPNPVFLNITCNEIGLSIFAEDQMLQDFELYARRDRQRQRSRSGSGSNKALGLNVEAIEISYEKWSVLQIDSHSDQMDNSGARVSELSAPLAAAGISILYQSSYMSDFIFVKECRLQDAMEHFASAGFHLYSSDSTLLTNASLSPSLSPMSDDRSSLLDFISVSAVQSPTILTRSRSRTNTSYFGEPAVISKPVGQSNDHTPTTEESPSKSKSKLKSHSPTSGEVRILSPDLTCVGLSDEFGVDHWGLKIVKLVAYPDLIMATPRMQHTSSYSPSYRTHIPSPLEPIDRFTASCSSDSEDGDDDGYFSLSESPQNLSSSSLTTSASRSSPDLPNSSNCAARQPASKHVVSSLTPLATSVSSLPQKPGSDLRVPFFSFTRTSEGSSLTADVFLLATLFPVHERHMVICGGELDIADTRLDHSVTANDDDDSESGTLKCLQIDLRRFGLDKHGLVNRFSRVLEEHSINHIYSSTFKTANLLVDKKYALRAQALLRGC